MFSNDQSSRSQTGDPLSAGQASMQIHLLIMLKLMLPLSDNTSKFSNILLLTKIFNKKI